MNFLITKNDQKISGKELTELYILCGLDKRKKRSAIKSELAIKNSEFFVTCRNNGLLVGFGRLLTDGAYIAYIFDVMTHPDYRKKGIAKSVMNEIMTYAESRYEAIYLNDGSGISDFYQSFGFTIEKNDKLMAWRKDTSG